MASRTPRVGCAPSGGGSSCEAPLLLVPHGSANGYDVLVGTLEVNTVPSTCLFGIDARSTLLDRKRLW